MKMIVVSDGHDDAGKVVGCHMVGRYIPPHCTDRKGYMCMVRALPFDRLDASTRSTTGSRGR